MTLVVATSTLGRYGLARMIWPQVRVRAGAPIVWSIFIDGSPVLDGSPVMSEDERYRLIHLAGNYADMVTTSGGPNVGVGAGIQAALNAVDHTGAHIKLDSDILPSPGYGAGFLLSESHWQNGTLGWLCALKYPHSPRHDVGPRRMLAHQRMPSGLSYLTDLGAAALTDHTTKEPINQHDRHIADAMTAAGLWFAYTHMVWMDYHEWQPKDSPYVRWKNQYLGRRATG